MSSVFSRFPSFPVLYGNFQAVCHNRFFSPLPAMLQNKYSGHLSNFPPEGSGRHKLPAPAVLLRFLLQYLIHVQLFQKFSLHSTLTSGKDQSIKRFHQVLFLRSSIHSIPRSSIFFRCSANAPCTASTAIFILSAPFRHQKFYLLFINSYHCLSQILRKLCQHPVVFKVCYRFYNCFCPLSRIS